MNIIIKLNLITNIFVLYFRIRITNVIIQSKHLNFFYFYIEEQFLRTLQIDRKYEF